MNEITEDTARKGKHTIYRLILARVLEKIRKKHIYWEQMCLMDHMNFQVVIYIGADWHIACIKYNIITKSWTRIDIYASWGVRAFSSIIKNN